MNPRRSLMLALILTMGWWADAQGQSFFAESEALQPGSEFQLSISDLTSDSSTDSSLGSELSVEESNIRRATARARLGFLGLGVAAEGRKFREQTEVAFQSDDRDSSAGYVALVLENLFSDNDALLLVASAGSKDETFTYETYTRHLISDTERQWGLVLQLGFLVLGYIEGQDRLTLTIEDPAITTIDEEYRYEYSARIAGLAVGDPDDFGLGLVWQRKETPAVKGTGVDLEEGFEELRRGKIGLGLFAVEISETRHREALTGQSSRETRERDVSLGVLVEGTLRMAITQKHIQDKQTFTLAGLPSSSSVERTENLLTFGIRF